MAGNPSDEQNDICIRAVMNALTNALHEPPIAGDKSTAYGRASCLHTVEAVVVSKMRPEPVGWMNSISQWPARSGLVEKINASVLHSILSVCVAFLPITSARVARMHCGRSECVVPLIGELLLPL